MPQLGPRTEERETFTRLLGLPYEGHREGVRMVVPSMYDMAEVMAQSGYTEEDVLDCGISGQIVFLVVVPEIGACRVPENALSHFMAGADSFIAERMPEHWTGRLSGEWEIKRERLRILADSWESFSEECLQLADALERASDKRPPSPAEAERLDYAALASRDQLIAAFGAFTGMTMAWFKKLDDTPALKSARKVTGRGQRGNTVEPLFCPFEVMLWLVSSKRKKGKPLGEEKGWELLERYFPNAYVPRSSADPR